MMAHDKFELYRKARSAVSSVLDGVETYVVSFTGSIPLTVEQPCTEKIQVESDLKILNSVGTTSPKLIISDNHAALSFCYSTLSST